MKMTSLLDGTNANAWVHPWDRDTTRGAPNLDSCPSMHSSEVKATMKVAVCQCCGVNFGYETSVVKAPAYCPSHKWLGEKTRIGVPLLNGVLYNDSKTGLEVTGRQVRWSYCFMEDDPKMRQELHEALTRYFKAIQLAEEESKPGIKYFIPRVVLTSRAVMVMDVQRLPSVRMKSAAGTGGLPLVDNRAMSRLFDELDNVYVEAL